MFSFRPKHVLLGISGLRPFRCHVSTCIVVYLRVFRCLNSSQFLVLLFLFHLFNLIHVRMYIICKNNCVCLYLYRVLPCRLLGTFLTRSLLMTSITWNMRGDISISQFRLLQTTNNLWYLSMLWLLPKFCYTHFSIFEDLPFALFLFPSKLFLLLFQEGGTHFCRLCLFRRLYIRVDLHVRQYRRTPSSILSTFVRKCSRPRFGIFLAYLMRLYIMVFRLLMYSLPN